ncbi:AI-2E family transporter [Jannaschia donghaensis]|uniref:Transport of quorum-sensing signal protein n=1 Tax=Jannaschia donghaensis TaxID=420998 RepID=A0A0M6YER9_9RHOB|nr:AI-2E family transporter [Jannaschia donghaensis]CTQ48828.1 Transport of quorum-sensing signal protein [Jannaschia donghaensis]
MSPDPADPAARNPLLVPVTGIFILLLIHALIFASDFLIPVTSAILGYFILNAPRRALGRIGIPSPVAAAIFTILIGAVLTVGAIALSEPLTAFVTDIPSLIDKVLLTLRGPDGPLELVNRAAEATDKVITETSGPAPMKVQVVGSGGLATSVASVAPGMMSQVVFAVFLLFFLVASGDLFIQKAVQVVDRFQDKRTTLMTIRTIEARLGNYLGAITLINIALGVAIGAFMWIWGVPSPWLLGMMATFLNFVPFVGAVVGSLVAGVVAFVAFGDLWAALGVLGTYYAITALEGQLLTPALVGQRLRLNVTMVFLSVAFFAWIWSVMGMVVAVPSLIVVKVVCDAVPRFRKVGLFLGDAEGFVPEAAKPDTAAAIPPNAG